MTAPYGWLRKIAVHLKEYDSIPLYGNAPQFDWERFSSLIASHFGVQNFQVKMESQSWRTVEELGEGLGDHVLAMPLKAGPLNGSAFWLMPKEEISKLSAWLLHGQSKAKPISSEILAEGFYRYLLLQAFDAASSMQPFDELSLLLSEQSPMPQTDAFCIDVEIEFDRRSCWGRLVIEPDLQKSWVHHFSSLPSDYIPSQFAQNLELDLGVKIGSCLLGRQEWIKAKAGDAILLDRGSYDSRKGQGAAYMMLGPTPLFQLKIKQNKIQLSDYALMYEEQMEKKMPPESDDNPFSGPAEPFPQSEPEPIAIKEMPVYVTVELARFKVTLEKLMHMAPGNLIELPIHPDQTVHLAVNGQVIGRGELVHLGETLAVRILEKG